MLRLFLGEDLVLVLAVVVFVCLFLDLVLVGFALLLYSDCLGFFAAVEDEFFGVILTHRTQTPRSWRRTSSTFHVRTPWS